MAEEMAENWVGPMPIASFLDEFISVPNAPPSSRYLRHATRWLASLPLEGAKGLCTSLGKCIQSLVLTPTLRWREKDVAPATIALLAASSSRIDTSERHPASPSADLLWLITSDGDGATALADPFDLPCPVSAFPPGHPQGSQNTCDSLCSTPAPEDALDEARKQLREAINQSLTPQFSSPARRFAFMLLLCNSHLRIIRADAAGLVVSEKFDIREEPHYTINFLWRFDQLSPTQRGLDPTIRSATSVEHFLIQKHLRRWKPAVETRPVVIQVPDPAGPHGSRDVLTWGAPLKLGSFLGRKTCSCIGYDTCSKEVVYLKDSWRSSDLDQEAYILRTLNTAGVRNVPEIICGGDMVEAGDTTLSSHYAVASWNIGVRPGAVETRRHHRFIVKFIGRHLDTFSSPKQLFKAVDDAFLAHRDAVEKCGILHRDISCNNIMMTEDGSMGVLNDWDMAKSIAEIKEKGPELPHAGTWQFMSARLLQQKKATHTIQDDIESFIYVVMYFAIRYMRHNISDSRSLLKEIFESWQRFGSTVHMGGGKRTMILTYGTHCIDTFTVSRNAALTHWINVSVVALEQWYRLVIDQNKRGAALKLLGEQPLVLPPVDTSKLALGDYTFLAELNAEMLANPNWSNDDPAIDNAPSRRSTARRGCWEGDHDFESDTSSESDGDATSSQCSTSRKRAREDNPTPDAAPTPFPPRKKRKISQLPFRKNIQSCQPSFMPEGDMATPWPTFRSAEQYL